MQHSYSITNICTLSVLQDTTKHFGALRLCGLMRWLEIWAKHLANTYGNVLQNGFGNARNAPKSILVRDGVWGDTDAGNVG